jgi:hypothetical protein
MTSSPDDETLAREFGKQREDDARAAPPFASMWRVRPRLLSPWWFALPVGALCAAAATFIWVLQTSLTAEQPSAAAVPTVIEIDPQPLAFLLDSPVLAPTPSFDESELAPR